jgi:lipopolysaccharide biosynthesis regulator YciM
MNKFTIILCCAVFLSASLNAQNNATIKEYKQSFPTYAFSDPNPIPLLTQVYPYFRYDGFSIKAVNKEWKVVELSNDYIAVLILPEIGGKIWAAIEKKNDRPFLYYNHVIKFRDVAMRGPWTSGGLESNFGIIGHTPNCATPVDYTTKTNADGSVSCIIGVLDLLTRSNWRVEINLLKDKAYFTTQAFWYNPTPVEQPYYHWMNSALKSSDDLEFIYPGNRYIGHNGEYASWPVNETNGKQISFYKNNDFGHYKSYHVFGKYTDYFGGYYHNEDDGMIRYSPHDDKPGKKIWIWGLSQQGMIWEKMLTDNDGQYVELQSGRLFNQNAEQSTYTPFKHTDFEPYATDTWKEYWYPVEHTKGVLKANEFGAFNMLYANGILKIYFSPTQLISDSLIIKDGDKIVYAKLLQLKPLQTFADSLQTNVDAEKLIAAIGNNKLVYNADEKDDLQRPVETPKDFDWNTAYGLYLQGRDLMDEKLYARAEAKLDSSLQKDHNFLPALVQMAKLMYRNMRYEDALQFTKRALSINTEDDEANYYYGLINLQLNDIVDAKDGFDIATLSPAMRSPAYTQLATVYLKEDNNDKALTYAQKAMVNNAYNVAALQQQAVIYRHENDKANAYKILDTILSLDALSHFALFEKYLWQNDDKAKQQFASTIQNELPAETYAELAVWYYNNNCKTEAQQVFQLSPASVTTKYWIAFLNNSEINFDSIDPSFSFPFRSETAAVIEQLLQKQDNWLLKYHLALIYHDRTRIGEAKRLLLSCNDQPDFAPFYATRAAIFNDSAADFVQADLKKAFQLDSNWRYRKLLAEFYVNHKNTGAALQLMQPYIQQHKDDYIMGMLYARILLMDKQYATADNLLTHLTIIPFEGATLSHELYRQAKLMESVTAYKNKNYKQSISFVQQARQWPENLGVGKPYDVDIDNRLEYWLTYLNYKAINKTSDANKMLDSIINNSDEVEATDKYFTNAIITQLAFRQLNKNEEGLNWLQHESENFPDKKIATWIGAPDLNNLPIPLNDKEKANVDIINYLGKE